MNKNSKIGNNGVYTGGIEWLNGGENGPYARPCDPEWVIALYGRCQSAGIPFFFKGFGTNDKFHFAGNTTEISHMWHFGGGFE